MKEKFEEKRFKVKKNLEVASASGKHCGACSGERHLNYFTLYFIDNNKLPSIILRTTYRMTQEIIGQLGNLNKITEQLTTTEIDKNSNCI